MQLTVAFSAAILVAVGRNFGSARLNFRTVKGTFRSGAFLPEIPFIHHEGVTPLNEENTLAASLPPAAREESTRMGWVYRSPTR